MSSGYIHECLLTDLSDECAEIVDFKNLLHEDFQLDKVLQGKFPLIYFGKKNDLLRIKGSKPFILSFESIDEKKFDIPIELGDIEYMGLNDNQDVILHFKSDDIIASGIYNFSYDFFEQIFSMGKYASFCLKNEYTDLLKENLNELFEKMYSIKKQYRIIKKDDEYFLRALTSVRYQNYDNNIAIYLSLLNLHKFAVKNNIFYQITYAFLSDSFIRIILKQEHEIVIKNVGSIRFGILITNNEVREGAFSVELRYTLTDKKGNRFSGMPSLGNSVFNIQHGISVNKIDDRLARLENLQKMQQAIIELISGLKNLKTISSDTMYVLYRKITLSKTLNQETRRNFKRLYDCKDIENAKTIIEAFDKISLITSDMNEKVFLERIYHEVITDLVK